MAGRVHPARRVTKLYRGHGFYLCRRCHDLASQCQREDSVARARRASGKIKARLGGNPDVLAPFPRKPKGMRQRTYRRECCRYHELRMGNLPIKEIRRGSRYSVSCRCRLGS